MAAGNTSMDMYELCNYMVTIFAWGYNLYSFVQGDVLNNLMTL